MEIVEKTEGMQPATLKKLIALGIMLVFIYFFATSMYDQREQVTLYGKTMGTTYSVKYIPESSLSAKTPEEVQQQIEVILAEVNRQMSTFIPTSEISQFNKLTTINQPFKISADFAKVVQRAIELNQVTQGRLDITIGNLVNLWSFGTTARTDKIPSAEEIQKLRSQIGIDKLKLSESNGEYFLSKTVPNLYIDLSAIAKGFGVDKVAQYLGSIGLKNYMVEIGGEIVAQGLNANQDPWRIGIETPEYDGSRQAQTIVNISNQALATSGDYRNYFEENGQRFSHEIDPQTSYPVQHHLASISVIAKDCMTADGLATGLFILGEEQALKVAEANNLAVYLIIKQGNKFITRASSAFKPFLSPTQSQSQPLAQGK